MINYKKLIANTPTKYGEMVNSIGQKIEFVEHPTRGDEHPVIAVCHELELAASTDFYELDDMTADHKEYEPSFQNNKFFIGEFEA
jgi:hypothetical protein